jgi:molybdopterin converting factor small subunit
VAHVVLPRSLAQLAGDELEFELDARNVRELIARLDERLPGFAELVEGQMAVAIDGEIHSDPMLEPTPPESEVHFLPRVSGGS